MPTLQLSIHARFSSWMGEDYHRLLSFYFLFCMFRCKFHMHNDPNCPLYSYWIGNCSDTTAKLKAQQVRIDEIEAAGWTVHTVWGCQWTKYKQGLECGEGPLMGHATRIQTFISTYVTRAVAETKTLSQDEMIALIVDGDMDGVVSCELAPESEEVRKRFFEFPPIYKKMMVEKKDLGPYMMDYCTKFDLPMKPRQQLISVTESRGESSRIDSRMFRWLIRQGYKVTKLHYFAQYQCVDIFNDIINRLVELRRYGDTDIDLYPICQMVKIFLNAGTFSI